MSYRINKIHYFYITALFYRLKKENLTKTREKNGYFTDKVTVNTNTE